MKHLVCFLTLVTLVLVKQSEGQGKTMHGIQKKDVNEKCPLLDGVYVSVMRRIFNPGFHKELLSEVEVMLTTTVLPDRCTLLMEETMPRGAYLDPDLAKDMRHLTGLRTFIPAKINIEKPEFESEAHRVFVFRNLEVQENLRVATSQIPVSIRYHRPAPADSSGVVPLAMVRIQNPRLMISCQGEDLLHNCNSRRVTTYCDETGVTKCEWLNLPYKVNVPSVEVSVPVGNSDHASLVVGVTTLITCGATIYILITMYREVKLKEE